MLKSDFYYDLPEELIAQTPVEPRNTSRMLKVDRNTGNVEHSHFYNLCDYLKKGDLLVLNDSRVLPARLYGEKENTPPLQQKTFQHPLQLSKHGIHMYQ